MATARHAAIRVTLVALATTALLTGCSDDDAGTGATGTTTTAAETTDTETTDAGHVDDPAVTAFCDEAPDPSTEVPASYVGSAEHVDDLRRLRDVAPDDLRDDLDAIVGHFDDEVDPADPDSQLVGNFPDEINEASGRVVAFIGEHCGS